jgi:hypothetical protein
VGHAPHISIKRLALSVLAASKPVPCDKEAGTPPGTLGTVDSIEELEARAAWISESAYRERAERVLRRMCENYEPGTILWLEANMPLLYQAVTAVLPNRISELWDRRASLEEFDAALAKLLETHGQAVAMCRAARSGQGWKVNNEPLSNGKWAVTRDGKHLEINKNLSSNRYK